MKFLLTSLGLVFIAEMGDKTQLVAMAFAAKYRPWKVMLGIVISISLLNLIAVVLGTFITNVIPINIIKIVAALIFLAFGLLNLREDNEEEENKNYKLGIIMTVALTFFIGELGDKTQLMTITLAAQSGSPFYVFLGSTLGMIAADSLGIIIGMTVFSKIPKKIVKIISSIIFVFFGTMGLYNSLPVSLISPFNILLYIILIILVFIYIYKYNITIRKKDKLIK